MDYFRRLLLSIGAILLCHITLACDCPPAFGERWTTDIVQKHIKASELVFIGEVIYSDGDEFAIKTLDVFKGEIKGDTIFGRVTNTCTVAPNAGLWIIYTVLDKEGFISIDLCSLSRNLTDLGSNPPPPPPRFPLNPEDQAEYIRQHELEALPRYLKNWFNEYVILAAHRAHSTFTISKVKDNSIYLNIIAIGLAIVALLISIFRK